MVVPGKFDIFLTPDPWNDRIEPKGGRLRKKFYLTTPLYYVNDVPHIGHTYTTVAADALARYKRLRGYEVFFLTGTDEHGDKILEVARGKGITPIELANQVVSRFQTLWKNLDISNDDFLRTTEERHAKVVKEIFLKLYEQDDIYKGTYEGWYCTPCETFWLESQLEGERVCPECAQSVKKLEEEAYLFRLSRYQERLLEHLEKNPDFVLPPTRKREVVEFIRGGLRDLSVTRLRLPWGIRCPVEEKHTIYVWVDALLNYISALGYPSDSRFLSFWPANVQLVGKDILKFHAIIWPALLMALGLEPPRLVFAHGWWIMGKEKMSKSRGNVVDPAPIIKDYGADALRYFLLREVPFGQDGSFSPSLFVKRVNSDLANDLGNLLNRTVPLVIRFCGGRVPHPQDGNSAGFEELTNNTLSRLDKFMDRLSFSKALWEIWQMVKAANLYIDRSAPWRLAKEKEKQRELHTVLYNLLEVLRILALMLFPFIPSSAQKIWEEIGMEGNLDSQILESEDIWGGLPPGREVKKGPPLFPRIVD